MVVIKLGGSLLTLPDWPSRLITLLTLQPGVHPLIIAGGGKIVDEIRQWDELFSLGDETCHRLALEAMKVTAALAARLIPQAEPVETRQAAQTCWSTQRVPVLTDLDHHCQNLPHCWDVTSDSLAAEVARQWHADELWLLKSTDWPSGITLNDARQRRLLDQHFPAFDGQGFMLKWCNLRASPSELILINAPKGEPRRVAGAGAALGEAPEFRRE